MQTIYHGKSNLGGRRSGSDRRTSFDCDYKGIEKRITRDRRKGTQQRKHPRFRVEEGLYAAIQSDYYILIGMIKNINKCGTAFQYVADGKELKGLLTIDIFSSVKRFYLKDMPFKAVADFYLDNKVPFSTIMLRQCGGKFVDLTDKQASQLDNFIKDYSLGEA